MSERFLPGPIAKTGPENPQKMEPPPVAEVFPNTQELKEEPPNDFETRYNVLLQEHRELAHEIGKAITMGSLMKDGVQTLISRYGTENFFQAIRDVQANGVNVPTTLRVIQSLEPDYTKREYLYKNILTDAERMQAEYEERERAREWEFSDQDARTTHYYAIPDSNATSFRVIAYEAVDRDLTKMGGFVLDYFNSNSKAFLENGTARGIKDLVGLNEDELNFLKTRLSNFNDNVFVLVSEMGFETDFKADSLTEQVAVLKKEINLEIRSIIENCNKALEELRANLLSDISNLNKVTFLTQEVHREMLAVAGNVDALIASEVQKTNDMIDQKTKPLHDLLSRLSDIERSKQLGLL